MIKHRKHVWWFNVTDPHKLLGNGTIWRCDFCWSGCGLVREVVSYLVIRYCLSQDGTFIQEEKLEERTLFST